MLSKTKSSNNNTSTAATNTDPLAGASVSGVSGNISQNKLRELAKDPTNQVYQYSSSNNDIGPETQRFSYFPAIIVERFQKLRIDFELQRSQFPNHDDDQLKYLVLTLPKNRHLVAFVDQHVNMSNFIFSKKNNNHQVSELLASMRKAVKEKNVMVPRTAENRIDENHPHYQESMNRRNQTFIKEIFQRGLVGMKPIEKQNE